MSTRRTLLGTTQAEESDDESETRTLLESDALSAKSTRIDGEDVEIADPLTGPTFEDTGGALSGEHGRPRPREFWTARQLGRTPPMQLIKDTVAQQLTGGSVKVTAPDDELSGAAADVAELVEDIYDGPHHQDMSLDNLLSATVSDLIDYAFAYWEIRGSADGAFPVAAFKPLPPLQVQHTVDDSGDLDEDPAYWWVPFRHMGGGTYSLNGNQPEGLEKERVVVMRHPNGTRSDDLYDESLATKVRQYLELIIDVDVHQKRHYSDSQLPSGFLHFAGNVGDDKLESIQNDIIEAAGDPHDLVTTTSEEDVKWIPVGESVVDLEALQQQQWYFKLVLAAAGLNQSEINVVEDGGFAKELPAWQRMTYKKVTKPMLNAIFDPQNDDVLPRITDALPADVGQELEIGLERFDPVQEQIERQETLDEWREGVVSLNEVRGGIGREATEVNVDVPGMDGDAVNIADLPKQVIDVLLDQSPEVTIEGVEESQTGPPEFEKDPVLSEREAFAKHGEPYDERAVKQLDDTIEVTSSFIESVAYSPEPEFLQIEFEKTGSNAVYWYANVEEFRFFNLIRASSVGSYFNKYIRHTGDPGYPYARVE